MGRCFTDSVPLTVPDAPSLPGCCARRALQADRAGFSAIGPATPPGTARAMIDSDGSPRSGDGLSRPIRRGSPASPPGSGRWGGGGVGVARKTHSEPLPWLPAGRCGFRVNNNAPRSWRGIRRCEANRPGGFVCSRGARCEPTRLNSNGDYKV